MVFFCFFSISGQRPVLRLGSGLVQLPELEPEVARLDAGHCPGSALPHAQGVADRKYCRISPLLQ